MENNSKANVKHMHPLPATTEDNSTKESQATQDPANTTAGSGLHDANCSDSSFDWVDGVCVRSDEHPHWVGKNPDQIMDEIEYGVGVLKRHGEALESGDDELRNLLDEEIASLLLARS